MTPGIQVCVIGLADIRLLNPLAANYLNDLWVFDIQEYKWKQVAMKDNERKPS
jgi:hypothetical protein